MTTLNLAGPKLRDFDPDPGRFRDALVPASLPTPVSSPAARTAAPGGDLVEQYRRMFNLDETVAGQLGYIYRTAVFACVSLRADLLSGLPIRLYRIGKGASRTSRDVRDPLMRLGMPHHVRGRRVADLRAVEEVDNHELLALLNRPNQDWTGRQLIAMTETGLGLPGQAHWQLHGRGATFSRPPSSLSWLKHGRMRVIKAGDPEAPASKPDQFRTIGGWWVDKGRKDQQKLDPREVVWFRNVDPNDPDYGALAPADIASLGADSYHDAMRSNRDIFRRGLTPAAVIMPPEGQEEFEDVEQMAELERDLGRKLTDRSARHRLAVLKYRFDFEPLKSVTPKDAEFVALMDFAIEDAARVYRIPIEFVGGARRTYQNMDAAYKGIWMMTLEPRACWLADEITEKVASTFGEDLFVGFDLSGVVALQEDEAARWSREKEQMEAKAISVNEWRQEQGRDPLDIGAPSLEVGKVALGLPVAQAVAAGQISPEQGTAILISAGQDPTQAAAIAGKGATAAPEPDPAPAAEPQTLAALLGRAIAREAEDGDFPAYGSDDHRRVMERRAKSLADHEDRIAETVERLLTDQRRSLAAKLERYSTADHVRMSVADLRLAFNKPEWVRKFREGILPDIRKTFGAAATELYDDVGAAGEPDIGTSRAVNFLRRRAQRFAEQVNDTTWEKLQSALADGIEAAEDVSDLAARVLDVMDTRLRSTPRTVARTEALGAFTGGSLEAAAQTGLELAKTWLSALDSRVRDTHQDAHGQTVALDEDFDVGGASGPGPGLMGEPAEDCNCRCTVVYGEARGRMVPAGETHVHAPAAR